MGTEMETGVRVWVVFLRRIPQRNLLQWGCEEVPQLSVALLLRFAQGRPRSFEAVLVR